LTDERKSPTYLYTSHISCKTDITSPTLTSRYAVIAKKASTILGWSLPFEVVAWSGAGCGEEKEALGVKINERIIKSWQSCLTKSWEQKVKINTP
jgi:hypothetical protein